MCLANGTRHRDDPKSARVYIILEGFGLLQGCFIMCHMPCVYNHFIIALQFHAYTQGRNAHSFTRTHPQAHSHSHPHKQTNKQTRAAARKECTHTHTHPHSHTHTHTHTHTHVQQQQQQCWEEEEDEGEDGEGHGQREFAVTCKHAEDSKSFFQLKFLEPEGVWCAPGTKSVCTCRCVIYRAGQNHIYMVCIRYFWQGHHLIYGHIRCIYTVLANLHIYVFICC